jgi:hypothetical protein
MTARTAEEWALQLPGSAVWSEPAMQRAIDIIAAAMSQSKLEGFDEAVRALAKKDPL